MDYKELGKRIREERIMKKLSQKELGEATGTTRTFIGYIERGERILSLETLVKISQCLNISLDVLVFGENTSGCKYGLGRFERLTKHCTNQQIEHILNIVRSAIPLTKNEK